MRPFLLSFPLLALGCPQPSKSPGDEAPTCAEGWFLDGEACVPEACGYGTWGELPVDVATVYVDASAADGGDGSAEAPLRSIQPALDLAGSRGGGLVAVAAGTYAETLVLDSNHAGVHLAGRCRGLVTLDASVGDGSTPGIHIDSRYLAVEVTGMRVVDSAYQGIRVMSGRASLVDLEVAGSANHGLKAYTGTTTITQVRVESCVLSGNSTVGLVAQGSSTGVTLVDSTVSDTRPDGDGAFGYGITVDEGAELSAHRCDLDGNAVLGLYAHGTGTEVALESTSIRNTWIAEGQAGGIGLDVVGGATLLAEGCDLEGNAMVGLTAAGSGTRIELVESTIRDTQPDGRGEFGHGILLFGGASLSARGCELAGNTLTGIALENPGTEVTLVDTSIRDTRLDPGGMGGLGIDIDDGALLDAESCEIEGNSGMGLFASGSGTLVTLHDTTIRDTWPDINGGGYGVDVVGGASLAMTDSVVERSTTVGLTCHDEGTSIALTRCAIRDTRAAEPGEGAIGVIVSMGAHLSADDCEISGSTLAGLTVAGGGSEATLRGLTVLDTLPNAEGYGLGVDAHGGARLNAEACTILDSTGGGLLVNGTGTIAEIRDSIIADTRLNATGTAGFGVQVIGGAQLSILDCEASGNAMAGILGSDAGTSITLQGVHIEDTSASQGAQGATAVGLVAQNGASVVATELVSSNNDGPGLYAVHEGTLLSCADCSIADNRFAAAVVADAGTLELSSTTLSGTGEAADLGGGVGVFAAQQWDGGPPSMVLTDCSITSNPVAAAWFGSDGRYEIAGSTLADSAGISFGSTSRCGDGVFARGTSAWDGSSGLLLESNAISDNAGAGLFLDASSASLAGNSWEDNDPDLLVQGPACLEPRDDWAEAPDSEICPEWDRPVCELEFHLTLEVEAIEPAMPLPPRACPLETR